MEKQTGQENLLIIGSGAAGYTAAIYAARANLSPALIAGLQPGGQLTITTDVENYPGFSKVVQGPWLMDEMRMQAEQVGTNIINDLVVDVDFSDKDNLVVTGDSGTTYTARAVVIATGAQARWLGLESENKYQGFGVSACATCDGFFFKGKTVAVIGGGNSAVEEALYLTHHAEKVYLVHRRDQLRAEKILIDRLLKNPKITPLWNRQVKEIIGTDKPRSVTAVRLSSTRSSEEETLSLDGVFVAIGHVPATSPFAGHVDMDAEGYIRTAPDSTRTSRPGVFAAGDVKDKVFRQAVTAAGMGCMAALEAERYLSA